MRKTSNRPASRYAPKSAACPTIFGNRQSYSSSPQPFRLGSLGRGSRLGPSIEGVWLLFVLLVNLVFAEEPRPIAQSSDGTIRLDARQVTIHGATVRYEPQPHKNTIGYWTTA